MQDALNSVFPSVRSERIFDVAEISGGLRHLWRIAKQMKFLQLEDEENLVPKPRELLRSWDTDDLYFKRGKTQRIQPFGQPITVFPRKADGRP